MKKIILIIAIVLTAYTSAWAGCYYNLDQATAAICNRQYESGAKICRDTHPDPLDYDNLAICIGYSKDVYHKCTGGCYPTE